MLQRPTVQAALLQHPSITSDFEVLYRLLATSKQLRSALAECQCRGFTLRLYLPDAALLQSLALWLRQHGSMLSDLQIRYGRFFSDSPRQPWAVALHEVSQSVRLACVTSLTSLQLCSEASGAPVTSPAALLPLISLQQLTVLRLEGLLPSELPRLLPPQLQAMHLKVRLDYQPQMLTVFAAWWGVHGSVVCSLELLEAQESIHHEFDWAEAVDIFASAMAVANVFAGTELTAVDATPPSSSRLQLQSFGTDSKFSLGPVIQHLPAHALTSLRCSLHFAADAHIEAAGRLTTLQQLELHSACPDRNGQTGAPFDYSHDVFVPLLALTRLTSLVLGYVDRRQLLQLPAQLREFKASVNSALEDEEDELFSHMQLEHATALTRLTCYGFQCDALSDGDLLPPNLQSLEWRKCLSVAPLLPLQHLRMCDLGLSGRHPPTAEQVQQLTQLHNLQHVRLMYFIDHSFNAAVLAAWSQLPVVSLSMLVDGEPALSWQDARLTSAVVQQLSAYQQLECLCIEGRQQSAVYNYDVAHLEATPGQLAAALRPLNRLQSVTITGFSTMSVHSEGPGVLRSAVGNQSQAASDVLGLVQVLAGMVKSGQHVHVMLPITLSTEASDAIKEMIVMDGLSNTMYVDESHLWATARGVVPPEF